MSVDASLYEGFLGTWQLIVESCRYEQGDPPMHGTYTISAENDVLTFSVKWRDAKGVDHAHAFSGIPDGVPAPYPGGDLADALSIHAVSASELNSSAFLCGRELMIAQRQLDATGTAMRVTQLVRLPDGTSPANVSIYLRSH